MSGLWEIENRVGLTENEKLWDRVSHDRLLSFIQRTDVEVASVIDSNIYGEFVFVDIWFPDLGQTITFWGMGYHERSERFVLKDWRYYVSTMATPRRKEKDLPPRERRGVYGTATVLEVIKKRQAEMEAAASQQPPPSPRAVVFRALAEISDEDGAMSLMEDYGLTGLPSAPPPLQPKKPPEQLTLWDRSMALLRRNRRKARPDELAYIGELSADFNPAVRRQMMRDLQLYPLFDAIAMWVQPVETALTAYEPRITGIAQDLIQDGESEEKGQ